MGHFTIKLPENKLGDVQYGIVRKKGINLKLFSKQKVNLEPKIAYRVIVGEKDPEVYWLYKSKDGRWTTDVEGTKDIDSYIYMYMKYFISEQEVAINENKIYNIY